MKVDVISKASIYEEKILKLFKIQTLIGGLDISDLSLKYALYSEGRWIVLSMRLSPGILEKGNVKDEKAFLEALKSFAQQIKEATKIKNKINVVVSLSSANVYSQVFTLPLLSRDKDLNQAVNLNMEMISPGDIKNNYSSWQILNAGTGSPNFDILGAFIDKKIIDDFVKNLKLADYFPVAFEPASISITRLFKQLTTVNLKKVYMILSVNSSGINFIIVDNGFAYFNYFNAWQNLGEQKQLKFEQFESNIIHSFDQVYNFYYNRWHKKVDEVILASSGLTKEISSIIENNFFYKPQEFSLPGSGQISVDWYPSLGAAIRGLNARDNKEINLLGEDITEEFVKEEAASFLNFWAVTLSLGFIILLIANFGSGIIFNSMSEVVAKQKNSLNINPAQLSEMNNLQAQVSVFNKSVAMIQNIEKTVTLKSPMISQLYSLAAKDGITISSLNYQDGQPTNTLTGSASSQSQIMQFQKDLSGLSGFSNVNLPLSNIQVSPTGFTFSLSFSFNGPTRD